MDWEDIFGQIAAQYGTTLSLSGVELVETHAAPPYTKTLDSAPRQLRELHAAGYRLVVATMGFSVYQFPVLKALGLYQHFDAFLTPDLVGHLKHDRAFWDADAAALAPGEALRVHVGDRYDHDCYFPKQYGLRSVLRVADAPPALAEATPFERPSLLREVLRLDGLEVSPSLDVLPDAVITHLDELAGVLAGLEKM